MTVRKAVFWLHLLCGSIAGIVILVMSVTGILLAFEPQIVDWAERDLRTVTPPAGGAPRLGLDALLAKVREARPDGPPTSVSVRSAPTASVAFVFGREESVFVDPYTGRILGPGSGVHQAMHVIEDWHRWLGSRDVGRPVTGACNAAFVGLVITGFYLWWPRGWSRWAVGAVTLFKRGLSGKARDFNWHNVTGFWCAPALLIISLTGLVMSYPWANDLLYRLAGSEPPPVSGGPGGPGGRGERGRGARPMRPLDPLLARAQERAPAWISISIRFGPRPDAPVSLFIVEPPSWHPTPRSQLTLDPTTAAVIKWEPYAAQSLGRRLRSWVRVLHTGEAAGVAGQVIALVASSGGALLVWTGIALAWRRWRAWSARSRRQADAPVAADHALETAPVESTHGAPVPPDAASARGASAAGRSARSAAESAGS